MGTLTGRYVGGGCCDRSMEFESEARGLNAGGWSIRWCRVGEGERKHRNGVGGWRRGGWNVQGGSRGERRRGVGGRVFREVPFCG